MAGDPRWRGFLTGLESIIGGAKEDAGAEYDLDRCLRLSCCDEHEESYGVIV